MGGERFDAVTRSLAKTQSRRQALKLIGGGLAGAVFAVLGVGEATADPGGCKRNGKKCKKNDQCCSGICQNGQCVAPSTCLQRGATCQLTNPGACCSQICMATDATHAVCF